METKMRPLLVAVGKLTFIVVLGMLAACSPASASTLQSTITLQADASSSPGSMGQLVLTPTIQNSTTPTSLWTPFPPTSTVPADTDTPTPTLTPTLPAEHYITGISGHKQYFPLGCEASTAVDVAAYFGHDINEFDFQIDLPFSDNPDYGFVGSVEGPWGQVPPYAYGVHAAPVAKLLQKYGVNAIGIKGFTTEELKRLISEDKPVIAWVIGNCVGGIPYEYTDEHGEKTIVAAYEHVIIVTGYSQDNMRYISNGKFYEVPKEVFENSWSVLGNMVLYIDE
jgi:uncharacterized protein YvpB